MKDIANCPYCQAEEWGCSENWGMGDEGWEELRRIHLEHHCEICTKGGIHEKVNTDRGNGSGIGRVDACGSRCGLL